METYLVIDAPSPGLVLILILVFILNLILNLLFLLLLLPIRTPQKQLPKLDLIR